MARANETIAQWQRQMEANDTKSNRKDALFLRQMVARNDDR